MKKNIAVIIIALAVIVSVLTVGYSEEVNANSDGQFKVISIDKVNSGRLVTVKFKKTGCHYVYFIGGSHTSTALTDLKYCDKK